MVKLKQSDVSLLWPLQLHSTLREENLGCPLCSQRGFLLLLLLLLLIEGWKSVCSCFTKHLHSCRVCKAQTGSQSEG